MSGYTKLFNSIVSSTIWQEDMPTRIVWITMLAMSDKDGVVEGSVPGLAHISRVSIDECEKALQRFQEPDKYSRTPDNDGKRIQVIDGGWLILNRAKYRDTVPDETRRERDRERQRKHRELSRVTSVTERDNPPMSLQKEKEKETKTVNPIHMRPDTASDVALFVMKGMGLAGRENRWTIEDAIKRSMEAYDMPAMGAASQIVTMWNEYEGADIEFRSGPEKFLKSGLFLSKNRWRLRNAEGNNKIEQLLATVSEPYGEPGEFSGADANRKST